MIRRPGLIAAIALGVVALAVVALIARPQSRGYEVTAVFEQANGLVTGGRVWAGGAVVGDVSQIRLGADGLPRVRMRIDEGYALHRGATADLRLMSNSGELNRAISGHCPRRMPRGMLRGNSREPRARGLSPKKGRDPREAIPRGRHQARSRSRTRTR